MLRSPVISSRGVSVLVAPPTPSWTPTTLRDRGGVSGATFASLDGLSKAEDQSKTVVERPGFKSGEVRDVVDQLVAIDGE